jgi:hypothetical protein
MATLEEKQQEMRERNAPQLAPYRFPSGRSGNPGGRKRSQKILEGHITSLVNESCPDEWLIDGLESFKGQQLTLGQAVALRAYYRGIAKGSMQAIAELVQRESGKMPNVQVTSKDEPDTSYLDMTPEEQQQELLRIVGRLKGILEPPAPTQDAEIITGEQEHGNAREREQ